MLNSSACGVCSSRGFEVIAGATPVLQVIFQYSVLLPTFRSWGPEGDALLDDSAQVQPATRALPPIRFNMSARYHLGQASEPSCDAAPASTCMPSHQLDPSQA